MKAANSFSALVASTVLAASLSSPASAAMNLQRAIHVCKSEVQQKYEATPGELRIKFKGIHGPRSAKEVRLQVIAEAETFNTLCTIDTRHYSDISIDRID